ncbi:MAG: electron transfer flavoprotein subunit alpha/FixB family protein [Nitrospirae bacterium]|nr:electron transfer flavoprotein subunit alpha/FixB family protein [Magnetococcales bacterium]HAT48970.1 electron transfer flavoprotein subunit alpha [Alphaproteobacteria bacterium]
MRVLVVASDRLGNPSPLTARAVTAGTQLGRVDLLVAGTRSQEKAEAGCCLHGVEAVLQVTHGPHFPPSTENLAQIIAGLAQDYRWIVTVHDTFGADVMGRVGGLLETSPITQVNGILDSGTVTRPVQAGQAVARVVMQKFPSLLTVRPTAFAPAAKTENLAPVRYLALPEGVLSGEHHGFYPSLSQRPDLNQAAIIVAGGQGLESARSFETVAVLADLLGGAVGATRGAVDAGLAPPDLQIGQTGRVVAPDLYIGLGISGAIQHLAGIKDSGMIVAINHDPGAPLHAVADFSLVADLFTAASRLGEIMMARKNK